MRRQSLKVLKSSGFCKQYCKFNVTCNFNCDHQMVLKFLYIIQLFDTHTVMPIYLNFLTLIVDGCK